MYMYIGKFPRKKRQKKILCLCLCFMFYVYVLCFVMGWDRIGSEVSIYLIELPFLQKI